MERGVVIIGAGHGGSQVGFSLRQEGYEGPIHLLSDEAELPYHKPPLSKAFLKDPAQEPQILRAEKAYADNRIAMEFGTRVDAIARASREVVLSTGARLAYDHLVIATGATNRNLSVPGHDLDGIFSLRTLSDARMLRGPFQSAQHIVVIGGGFIGLEAAAVFAGFGKMVTIIEMAPSILGRALSQTVAGHVDQEYRKLGIAILTGAKLDRIEGDAGRVRGVVLATGETVPADLVLVGIGATPNDSLARAAGLDCDNGIEVDAMLRTSDPAIFAIGDVACFPHLHAGRKVRLESVQNASDHAKHVAKVIAGKHGDYREIPWFWSDQGPMKLQMTGLSFDANRELISGSREDGAFSVYRYNGDRLIAVESVNRPADHMVARRLLAQGCNPSEAEIAQGPHCLKEMLAN